MTPIVCEACKLGQCDRCVELRRKATDRSTPIRCWCECDISQRRRQLEPVEISES